MSLSTMSWAEGVVDPNRKPTRRSANTYVPPHLRPDGGGVGGFNGSNGRGGSGLYGYNNNNNNNNGYGGGYRAPGRAGPGRGGFGVGRSRGWIPPPSPNPNPNPNPNPRSFYPNPNARPFNPNPRPGRDVDVSRKLRQLRVSGEDDVSGGGERDGDGDGDNVGGGTINFEAYEDIPVEASGSDVPAPAASFAEIDLGERLNGNIRRCRYARPTPVQRHAIPIAVAGRDLMACAQTGSGKTAAFCFPIIRGVLKNRGSSSTEFDGWTVFPMALVLSPTRELASQIYEEAEKFAYQTGVKIAVVYGGAPMGQQLQNMERGVDILVATPGRLVDLIDRSRVSLAMIKYLALDEADRMLDMGFEPQIRKIVQQMDMPPPGKRQTLLFSATFPSEIQRLAADFLLNYIFLTVGRVGSSTDLIAQKVEFVADKEKAKRLISLLNDQRNGTHGKLALTLVFVETKKGADSLERWLSRNGFPAIAIHGDKVQMERERALRSFKCGSTPILVATDVASRGLDIPHVAHVINFDFPKSIDDYVHRIGRTGRAGKSGLATAFFGEKNQPHAQALVELMKESKQEVPSWLVEYAKESSSYGGDQSQRYGSSKFGGYDFRRSENHYGSGSYGYGDSSMGVAATTGSYAAGSYGYSGHGDSSADAPAASFNDGAGSYGYSGQYEDSSAHASAASDTLPTSGGSDFAGTVHSFSSENYKNIVASGWD